MVDSTDRVAAMLRPWLEPGEKVVAGAYATMRGAVIPVYLIIGGAVLAIAAAASGTWLLMIPAAGCVVMSFLLLPRLRRQRVVAIEALGVRLRAGMALAVTDHGRLIVCRARPGGQFMSDVRIDSLRGVSAEGSGERTRGSLTITARDGRSVKITVGKAVDARRVATAVRLAIGDDASGV